MSGALDVKNFSTNISTVGASSTVPVCYFTNTGGDVTVLSAKIAGYTAGTPVGLKIVTMTDVGTPVISGTIGSFGGTFAAGTITMAAGVVFDCTISTPRFTTGQWLAVQNTSGTTPAICHLTINYVTGT
jgi:hypothetical protein